MVKIAPETSDDGRAFLYTACMGPLIYVLLVVVGTLIAWGPVMMLKAALFGAVLYGAFFAIARWMVGDKPDDGA